MSTPAKWIALITCLLALTGVVMAALGSHLVDLAAVERGASIWQTATMLHLLQSAAILALSAWLQLSPSKSLHMACWTLLLGTLIFCVSLYLRVISAGSITGAAPLGGLLMMAGWLLAAWSFAIGQKQQA